MKRKSKNFFSAPLLLCLLLLCTTGCGQEILYNNLSQEDANKIMDLLQQHGVQASKEEEKKQNEVFWTVKVDAVSLPKARNLIVASNVIAPKAPGLQEVYQGKGNGGWIKTPAEERARYILALKGEVINALKKLPEVVDADVVLNVPVKEKFSGKEDDRPTASVVVKAQKPPVGEQALNDITVQQWVANAVEGLAPRDVAVLINYVAPLGTDLRPGETVTLPVGGDQAKNQEGEGVSLMGLKMAQSSKERLKIYLIIFFTVLVILSLSLIVSVIQVSRTRHELKAIKEGESPKALEGEVASDRAPRLRAGTKEEEHEEP